ncbi:PepSY domain-containing protein [Pseudoalteromonas luteoviolacea]|uniref:PepSY domain-containing protein n=1 Tax=Pseudoalteromonas luteoviolacea TaxID=43657 RepID=UPI001F1C652D|nr:PepSY domain-containing protein [Pseudoalteromonas luteoviolacea]MCF6438788.1 PepSY domain-containing protein [Pseudoalteromonas luteoviolacea]
MLKHLLIWHKRIALCSLVPLVIWALSGLLHPAMSHFAKASIIKNNPVAVDINDLQSYTNIQEALTQNGIVSFSHASLIKYKEHYFYQVQAQLLNDLEVHYLPLNNTQLRLTDIEYAKYLAQNWSGLNIQSTQRITQFSTAYPEINRILPVYRVQLDNGNNLYIDTLGKRIATHNTPLRESLSYWFKQLHTWQFAGDRHSPWRLIPMLFVSTALFIVSLFGLVAYSLLWSKVKSKRKSAKSLHRGTGLVLSLSLLGFASSSSHILIDKFFIQEFRALLPTNSIFTRDINHDPVNAMRSANGDNFQLLNINGEVVSQVVQFEKQNMHFSYWQSQETRFDNASVARSVLLDRLGISGRIHHHQKIDKFGPTYGFVNKRLPVQQISFEHSPEVLYSVEIHTGYIAAIDDNWQKARSWHFGYLHKYHFLNPLGKGIRDSIIALICLGLVFVASTGTYMYVSRSLRQRRAKQQRNLKNNELLENN